jgi:pre-mRNA-splicing factor 38A
MANRTDPKSKQLHGMNPQMLLETILRNKIYNTLYWKEKCFALNSETIIDKAMELQYIGGTYGGTKHPTEFICLILKLLQIQPSNEIIDEYLSDSIADYKYLRALAAFYVRLTQKPANVYKKLEPLYNDFRKLRMRNPDNGYAILHMDEFIEELLHKESVFEITLPAIPKRRILEQNGDIGPRVSLLEADLDLEEIFKGVDEEKDTENKQDYFDDMDINIDKLDNIDEIESNNSEDSISDNDSGHYKFSDNKKRYREFEHINEKNETEIVKINAKKRKTDMNNQEKNTNANKNNSNKAVDFRQLDPNSDEYWLEMRKHLGIK